MTDFTRDPLPWSVSKRYSAGGNTYYDIRNANDLPVFTVLDSANDLYEILESMVAAFNNDNTLL